jgi:hypothetical protein
MAKARGVIARWTTPSIRYTPKAVGVEDIAEAEITIKQRGIVRLHKTMDDAAIIDGSLLWSYTQEETGSLTSRFTAIVQIDFKTTAGMRYTTRQFEYEVVESAVSEVI